jgi:hypothetical protein
MLLPALPMLLFAASGAFLMTLAACSFVADDDEATTSATHAVTVSGVAADEQTLFANRTPQNPSVSDTAAVELGLKFRAAKKGLVTGVRFYKGTGNGGGHVGHLWSASGNLLSTVTFTSESASGWQVARFPSPVAIAANTTYVVSYYAPRGRYAGDNGGMGPAHTSGDLTALASDSAGGNGVYRYGASGFPTSSYRATNYWVDVVFKPDGATPGTDAGTPPPTPTTPPTTPPPTTSLKGWQLTASNTGIARIGLTCASLPLYSGPVKPAAGTTISGKRLEHGLDLSAGSIVIEKSCIRPTSVGRGMPVLSTTDYNRCNANGCPVSPSLVTIRDSDIDGSLLGAESAALATGFLGIATLQRNYIHDFGSGIGLMNTGPQISATVAGNYVTKLRAWGDPATTGNHSDAFTVRDFDARANPSRRLAVQDNRFDCSSGNDTGAFFIQTFAGNIENMTAEGNLLEGNGYQLGLNQNYGNTYRNLTAINNRFSGTGFGAAYVQGGEGWAQWQENYINNPSQPDNKGRALVEP